jgi:hypothetical protein
MAKLDELIRTALASTAFDALGCSSKPSDSAKTILSKAEAYGPGDTAPDVILQRLCWTDDEKLLEVARSAGVDAEPFLQEGKVECWSPFRFRLFVSHVSDHKAKATELGSELVRFGIQAFVAHQDILPTHAWREQIKLALQTCDALIAIMTPKFHESEWTDQEIGFVLGLGRLAVVLDEGQGPYGFVADLQAFKGAGKSAAIVAEEIFKAFSDNPETRERLAEAVVMQLVGSSNYANAKGNIALVERLPGKYPALATRLRAAKVANSQVGDEFQAPEKIDRLYQEWTGASLIPFSRGLIQLE